MKSSLFHTMLLLNILLISCQPQRNADTRPKSEISFLHRVKNEGEFSGKVENVAQQDAHIKSFDKYAADSLKNIQDWKMIYIGVNDNSIKSNSIASALGINNAPCYNIELVAPVGLIRSEGEFGHNIAEENRVNFTYTLLKSPNDANLEKRIELIKTLKEGDTVVVSGTLTHVDLAGKTTFAPLFVDGGYWNVDLLATKLEKSNHK